MRRSLSSVLQIVIRLRIVCTTFTLLLAITFGFFVSPSQAITMDSASAPGNVNAAYVDESSVSLSWLPGVGGGVVTDYVVQQRIHGSFNWDTFDDGISTETSAVVTGLTRGQNYDFRVGANNGISTTWMREVETVTTTSNSSCALYTDGTVSCWGANSSGELGVGNARLYSTDVPQQVQGIADAVKLVSGENHLCALLASGDVKCWGWNLYGQLGDGTTATAYSPIRVDIRGATDIAAGTDTTCALITDGVLKCWGKLDGTSHLTPAAPFDAPPAIGVAVGEYHVCVVTVTFNVSCWGNNAVGQLGSVTANSLLFNLVPGVTASAGIFSSRHHTCALTTAGTVSCWGWNSLGQLGNGNQIYSTPSVVIDNAVSVGVGYSSTCAVLSDGSAKCWGGNSGGQLGDGTTTTRTTPVTVPNVGHARSIAVGLGHVCAVINDGTVDCWGNNPDGQLGRPAANPIGQRFTAHAALGVASLLTAIPSVVPASPESLAVTVNNRTSLSVSWTAPDNGGQEIVAYAVQYSLDSGLTWLPDWVARVSDTSTTLPLSNGTNYLVRVAAVNPVGTGPWTTSSSTLLATTPDAPTDLRVSSFTASSVSLSWTTPAVNGGATITDYTIQYRLVGAGEWSTFNDGTSTSTNATVTGLTQGSNYEFQVGAINSQGTSFVPSVVSAIPSTVAAEVSTLNVSISSRTSLLVNWAKPSDDGGQTISDYLIEYSDNAGADWSVFADGINTATSATLTGLINGSTYTLRVSAVNAAGTGPKSVSSSVHLVTVPDTPTALSVAGFTGTSVSLSWTAPAVNGGATITDYTIQYRLVGAGEWSTFNDGTSTSTNATVTGLTQGSNFEFQVGAVNAQGTTWTLNKISQRTTLTYFLTYIYNLATGGNTVPTAIFTTGGNAISLPSPTRIGYAFAGWYSDLSLTIRMGYAGNSYSPTGLTQSLNAYAKWSANTYTVTYAYNNATGGERPVADSYTTGGSAIILPAPTRTGYTFAGWYSDPWLTSQIGDSGSAYSPIGETLVVPAYAKWIANTHVITYNANGATQGTPPLDSYPSHAYGTPVTVQANPGTLTKTGYSLTTWNTQANGLGVSYGANGSATFIMGDADILLYAQWTKNLVITTKPTITGTAKVAKKLTAKKGSWNTPTPAYTYQWYSCAAKVSSTRSAFPTGCAAISSATGSTFILTNTQKGFYVTVGVTANRGILNSTWWSKSTAKVK